MAAVEPPAARNGTSGEPKLTNGYPKDQQHIGRGMSETNGTDSNGGYPPPPGPPMHNSYGSPYGGPGGPPPPQGYPAKVPPQGGYPGTPTLNSLLQDRRYPPGYEQAGHGGPPPGGHGGPPGGPPGGHGVPPGGGPPTGGPAYPGWAYGHPGYRSQGPRPPFGYGGGYPGYGGPRYPSGEPQGYAPADRGGGGGGGYPPPQQQGGVGQQGYPPSDNGGPGGPPPAPGKHEGPPASTWTPPVPNRLRQNLGSGPPPDGDGGRSPSDDGRPGSTEPGVRGGPSPRPRPSSSPSPRPRPSPSPTGSSSSRSMSPAVGVSRDQQQQPPRPGSGPNEPQPPPANNGGPMSAAMTSAAPGGGPGYPGQPNMGPPPHMYKGGPHGPPPGGQPPYGYPGGYGPRPGYGGAGGPSPYPGYGPPRNSSPGPPPPGQYPGYGSPYPPQGQWNGQNGGKGGGPLGPNGAPGAPRHPSMPPQPGMRMGGPGGYMPAQKGPPYPGAPPPPNSYNGPSMMPPGGGAPPGMGPPPSSSPGYPPTSLPPSSTPNSLSGGGGGLAPSDNDSATTNSIVTTGPDGQPIHDDTSQQSTLSQSSDNSGGRQTPKGGYGQGYGGAPGTPHSAPSPGSMGSSQDDPYQRDVGSPGHWGRVPPSPVGTPGPQAKVENLQRLYEIDDHPERRAWLDKLLGFMEERGTPITQCPTISKNPLDLYRLYIFTKDRGGFLECTNKKAWKDIAAQLGIGPSSSGAYTLKKHYGKNLLPFECHFERGGIDPGPILAQVEAQSKKKGKGAQAARPPSPGSQDSHDSLSQDGYGGGGGSYAPGYGDPRQQSQGPYPPGGYPPSQRPPGPDGYGGPGGPNYSYPGQGPPPRWPYEGASPAPGSGGDYSRWGGYPPRPGYPPGPPGPTSSSGPTPPPSSQPYDYQKGLSGPNGPMPPGGPGHLSGPPGHPSGPRMMMRPPQPQGPSHPVILRANSPATPGTIQDSLPPALPVQRIPNPHGYAPPSSSPGAAAGNSSGNSSGMPPPGSPGYAPGKGATPPVSGAPPGGSGPTPGSGPPNRAPYPPNSYPQGPHRPIYPGPPGPPGSWSGNRYPPGPAGSAYPPSSGPRPGAPPGPWPPGQSGPPYGGPPGTYGPSGAPPGGPWPPRTAPSRPAYRPDMRAPQPSMPRTMGPGRREIYNFPVESLESTQPLLLKRKKLNKTDVQPVEGWRLVMALRSGLLMESSWALDTLNVLLYDDNSVTYFGLGNMPGLLEALIEHWRASLIAMFDLGSDLEMTNSKHENNKKRKREKIEKSCQGIKWYEKRLAVEEDETGLGSVDGEVLRRGDKVRILHHQPKDFTTEARFKEKEFQFEDKEEALFVEGSERPWDAVFEGFSSNADLWAAGGGDTTDHILPADGMFAGGVRLPFVRVLKDGKDGPASADNGNSSSSPVKKEEGKSSSAAAASAASEISPKKHGKRVRETWKVSPKSEDKTSSISHAAVAASTNSNCNSSSSSNTSNSSSANNSCDTTPPSSSSQSNNLKVKSEEEPLSAVKTEGNDESKGENEEAVEKPDVIEALKASTGILVVDPTNARRRLEKKVLEEENYQPDQASLNLVSESEDSLGRRAIAVSTILRNLSFVPGNEAPLGNSPGFLAICGKVILHGHWHPERSSKQRNYDKGEDEDYSDSCTSLLEQKEWWWEHLQVIRENVMVALSNCAGHMDLGPHPENVVLPLLQGLLEWAVSPAAAAQDSFPSVGVHSNISPQRLAIETLCKLCITESNVDLLLSTPPYSRLENLCSFLAKKLYRSEDQVMREFAINLLFYFSGADSGVARTIALQDTAVSLLIGFIEQAENNAMMVAQQHGVNALRDNPDSMGTSLDMLRRAANTLNNLSRHPANTSVFLRHEQRLLNLVMSQILDQGVAGIISQVIYQISTTDPDSL